MAGTASPVSTPDSGNTLLEGLLWGTEWSGGATTTVAVYVAGLDGNETVSLAGGTVTALGSIYAQEVTAIGNALAAMSAVANIIFTTVASQGAADIIFASLDDAQSHGALGWANPPGGNYSNASGDYVSLVTANHEALSVGALAPGGYDYITYIHELGHALGLAHPHDTGGGSTVFPGVTSPFGDYGDADLNQGIFSMMSYNNGWQTAPHGTPGTSLYGWEGTPMALDIAALQFMYGANAGYHTGSDTYTMPGTNGAGTYWSCIWDAGGTDAVVGASGRANAIDLRAATLRVEVGGGGFVSYAAGIHGGFTIANGVTIENATGGEMADAITGNAVANSLFARDGADVVTALAGNDTVAAGAGNDAVDGGEGLDLVLGDGGLDTIVGGAGNDVVAGGADADVFRFDGVFGNDTISGTDLSERGNTILFGDGITQAMITTAVAGADLLVTVSGGSGAGLQQGTVLLAGWVAAQAAGNGFGTLSWTGGTDGSLSLLSAIGGGTGGGGGTPTPTPTGPIKGTSGNNVLTGTASGDQMLGYNGNDRLTALAGDDTADGGSGNDTLDGGEGADRLLGDLGNDRLMGGAAADSLDGGGNVDSVEGGDGNDLLDGGAGDDRLLGAAGADSLDGDTGKDLLFGGDGDDTLFGGASSEADVLRGEAGNDSLLAGAGLDTLDGGGGNDVLSGGTQADLYVFAGDFGADTISLFDDTQERAQDKLDKISLSAYRSFNGNRVLTMSDLKLTQTGANVVVELDLDSNGVGDSRDWDADGSNDTVSITVVNTTVAKLQAFDFVF